jgi:D-glycero-D-manno-heptose 1,7-bisphosphate phosphatase
MTSESQPLPQSPRALFLDRDDTLVRDAGYMSRPEQIELLPGVAEALRDARGAGFRLYLVTNQSGINRGYYSLDDALACNRRLEELLGVGFDGVCIAPERPDEPSRYRKPSPAYLLERIAEDGLDPAACWMVGDKVSDLECGLAAGVRAALVARGSTGAPREDAVAFAAEREIPVFPDLPAFVRDLLSRIPDGPEKKK